MKTGIPYPRAAAAALLLASADRKSVV